MQMQSSKYERMSCNIQDIINSTGKEYACHEFTGCNTNLQIHNFVKKLIFSKLEISKDVQQLSKQFYHNSATVNEIGNASIRVF